MAYSELIKDFGRIRTYMRQFYVYGFKSRGEYSDKSTRSYDNERRRMESWLGNYMSFRQSDLGKTVFISVDSGSIPHNPLYQAFKTKSFTANDITLHFYILDILAPGKRCTVRDILDQINSNYLSAFQSCHDLDESTIRKKLKEYELLGLIQSEKRGRELFYYRADQSIHLDVWWDALAFFSEADPLGVVGSFLLDKCESIPSYFTWKQHYILHALESQVLLVLLDAISEHRDVCLQLYESHLEKKEAEQRVIPLKIYVSTQNGRRYLMSWNYKVKKIILYRMDNIRTVRTETVVKNIDQYLRYANRFQENLWGVSSGVDFSLDHVEMTIFVDGGEEYIVKRLEREKRCGKVEMLDGHHVRFVADVYDATEMLPWIRTFIGNIKRLESNNEYMVKSFYEDLERMEQIYGGELCAIQ